MIRKNAYIFIVAGMFLAIAKALNHFEFWRRIGLAEPHGYVFTGILFLTLLFVLQNTLFSPFVDVLDERDNQTVKKKEAAEKTRADAERMLESYRKSIDEARIKATFERERMAMDAETDERGRLLDAKQAGAESLSKAIGTFESESRAAKKELTGEVETLAKEIVEKVVAPAAQGKSRRAERGLSA